MEVFLCPFDVSVPCRGLWFLNLPKPSPKEREDGQCFRPLSGFMVSQLKKAFRISLVVSESFRPLSGFMVSQYTPDGVNLVYVRVSVPCRGLWFLNEVWHIRDGMPHLGFRPLSGFMVSQS